MALKNICPPDHCTGCMACTGTCAHEAITIIRDSLGFSYPMIDLDKCTGCGLCEMTCPENRPRQLSLPKECYAAAMSDQTELLSCASGGVATALSVATIKTGGAVVGCSGSDFPVAKHIIVETLDGLDLLKGSKYVQSTITPEIYKRVREILRSGRQVLFTGTGCQIAGIQNFLRKDYPNLVTVDLVCHGVPSQQMLADNLALYPRIDSATVAFRKKTPESNDKVIRFGLNAQRSTRIGGKRKPMFVNWYKDPYLGAFMACVNFRTGCYNCRYARPERQSDITICDFWGLGKDSTLKHSAGVSAALINTQKGKALFDAAASMLSIEQRTVDEAVKGNGQLQRPSQRPPQREQFIEIYEKSGIKKAYRKTVYKSMLKKHYKELALPVLYPIYRRIKKMI